MPEVGSEKAKKKRVGEENAANQKKILGGGLPPAGNNNKAASRSSNRERNKSLGLNLVKRDKEFNVYDAGGSKDGDNVAEKEDGDEGNEVVVVDGGNAAKRPFKRLRKKEGGTSVASIISSVSNRNSAANEMFAGLLESFSKSTAQKAEVAKEKMVLNERKVELSERKMELNERIMQLKERQYEEKERNKNKERAIDRLNSMIDRVERRYSDATDEAMKSFYKNQLMEHYRQLNELLHPTSNSNK